MSYTRIKARFGHFFFCLLEQGQRLGIKNPYSSPTSPTTRITHRLSVLEHLSGVPVLPPAPIPSDNLASDPTHGLLTIDQQCNTSISIVLYSSTRLLVRLGEHVPASQASPPAPPDKPLSDHMHEHFTEDEHSVNATSTESSPFPILTPPDQLHPTLSCWIKNMDKLSSLIDRLQELASSAPPQHRAQLLNQVVALRATSEKQKDHFTEFLQLTEEYANRYLLDISAEVQQQSSFLKKLGLQRSYVKRPLICKTCTNLERLPLWRIFVRQVRQPSFGFKAKY